jgi:hypothetical protein
LRRLGGALDEIGVAGPRYNEKAMAMVDR